MDARRANSVRDRCPQEAGTSCCGMDCGMLKTTLVDMEVMFWKRHDIDIDNVNDIASNPSVSNQEQHSSESKNTLEPWIDYVRRATHKAEDSMRQHGSDTMTHKQIKMFRRQASTRDTSELQMDTASFTFTRHSQQRTRSTQAVEANTILG